MQSSKGVADLWWEGDNLHVELIDGSHMVFKNAVVTDCNFHYDSEDSENIKVEKVNMVWRYPLESIDES